MTARERECVVNVDTEREGHSQICWRVRVFFRDVFFKINLSRVFKTKQISTIGYESDVLGREKII